MLCSHQILLKSGILVPCGKCPACLANKRQELVFRLKEEFKDSVFALFVTLTYDEEHLPLYGVSKRDIQLFNKRLRKHFPAQDCRFFVVSEYGDRTQRAHYHGLYFFKHQYDKKFIYDIFDKSWSNGFISFGEVEEGSIVYCTKYCLKGTPTPPGKNETFRLMSKMNGGLGAGYLNKLGSYHVENNQFSFVASDGKKCRMPRYYRDKLNPFKGASKYNPLHLEIEMDSRQSAYDRYLERFRAFLVGKHFPTLKDAEQAFNDYNRQIADNGNELILKHCKKQKF